MTYLKSERVNDERTLPDEHVTDDYVRNYVDARGVFESLGGTEEYRKRGGVIYCKSTSPDGETVREVVFTKVYQKRGA